MNHHTIDPDLRQRALKWTCEPFDAETRMAVEQMLDSGDESLTDAFYRDLEFGTGGMRGIMGPGTNRMNRYTIGMSTQGLANYLKRVYNDEPVKVAIAFDCRNNSPEFAQICADVLSGNGFEVLLFESLRPTPELSFAIRHYGCASGIMITASHNPKEYNGFKVYWNDGAQLVPPHDLNVVQEAAQIKDISAVKWVGNPDKITILGEETDKIYIDRVCTVGMLGKEIITRHSALPLVYSPLHGTGTAIVPAALKAFGFQNVISVPEQSVPDGNFPTVISPNPEESEALTMAIRLAGEKGAELVMATDPDSDRVGIAVKDDKGEFILLNGNETAVIIIYYLLEQWKSKGMLTGNQYIVKTIVTSYLLDKIAESYGVECFNVLTGFKYIAAVMRELEGKKQYIAGGEESYGLLIGDFVRDKDAVSACCIIAEAAAWAKEQSMTLLDMLRYIHGKYGVYREHLISVTKKGKKGAEEISNMMDTFRNNPPLSIDGFVVEEIKDYKSEVITSKRAGETSPTRLPSSNVLQLKLENDTLITMRPSGTEPKIKFYFSVNVTWNKESETWDQINRSLNDHIQNIIRELKL